MIVYVLLWGNWEPDVIGVYSTLEAAQKAHPTITRWDPQTVVDLNDDYDQAIGWWWGVDAHGRDVHQIGEYVVRDA